jgi:hypothetical protein
MLGKTVFIETSGKTYSSASIFLCRASTYTSVCVPFSALIYPLSLCAPCSGHNLDALQETIYRITRMQAIETDLASTPSGAVLEAFKEEGGRGMTPPLSMSCFEWFHSF